MNNNSIIEYVVNELLAGNLPKQKDICKQTGKSQVNVSITMKRHGLGYLEEYAPLSSAVELLRHGVDRLAVHERTGVSHSVVSLLAKQVGGLPVPKKSQRAEVLLDSMAEYFFENFEIEPPLPSCRREEFRGWWRSAVETLDRHNSMQQSTGNTILICDLMERIFFDSPVYSNDPKTGE